MNGRYDLFLVDADNTVLDFHASSMLSLKRAFSVCDLGWKEEYGKAFTDFNDMLWGKLERKEITRDYILNERFPAYLKNLGFSSELGEKFNQAFLEHLGICPVYVDGAREFLCTLRKRGRVYIVTNGTEKIQKSRFSISGLNNLCDGVFVSETIGYNKPSREYVEYVRTHIEKFQVEKAVWIGDSLNADMRSAREMGVDGIWFAPNGETDAKGENPVFVAKKLSEILVFLGF